MLRDSAELRKELEMAEGREDSSIGTSLLTFLLGVAVGATVAILYAPASGSETREKIAEKAGALKEKAGELKTNIVDRASEWKEKAAAVIHRAGDPEDNSETSRSASTAKS